jgi:hypothetical protein
MTTEQKIEAIKQALEKAKNHQSKMDDVAWSVPALSSLKIRHLMNNLGAISTNYLECGVHRGGLFCSTLINNNHLRATANDNFASDMVTGEDIEHEFAVNRKKCTVVSQWPYIEVKKCDTFDVKPETIAGPIDLYLFDADHSYESQRKAMTHFLPAMADEFIVCVDDFDWPEVAAGTTGGLHDANVDILFQEIWKGNDHDNDGAWNGFYIALLKKK